jgi:hypothetical protein
MSRRPSLKDAIEATEKAAPSNDNSFGAGGLQPSSLAEDRRGVLVRVSMDVRRKLKLVAINRNTTVQDLLIEAIAAILEEPDPAPRP